MEFLNNLVRRIRAVVKYRLEQVTRSLPFRMAVGRLGIRLSELGRFLQVRYANWNSEFRLKSEHIHEDAYCIHVSEQVTDQPILSFSSRGSQYNAQTPMVSALLSIKGVASMYLNPYKITIHKGNVFSWPELLPSIEKVILEHLTRTSV